MRSITLRAVIGAALVTLGITLPSAPGCVSPSSCVDATSAFMDRIPEADRPKIVAARLRCNALAVEAGKVESAPEAVRVLRDLADAHRDLADAVERASLIVPVDDSPGTGGAGGASSVDDP